MDLDTLTFVTGNEHKRREAERILGTSLRVERLDLPEIQGLDLMEILRAKGREAQRRLGMPVLVEETGLELAALGGFPGPLVRWMLESIGAHGIARIGLALGNPSVTARCAVLAFDGTREAVGEGMAHGTLVDPPRGDAGFGWDPVFQPAGESRTYAELGRVEKDRLGHRGRAWRALLAELEVVLPLAQSSLRQSS